MDTQSETVVVLSADHSRTKVRFVHYGRCLEDGRSAERGGELCFNFELVDASGRHSRQLVGRQ